MVKNHISLGNKSDFLRPSHILYHHISHFMESKNIFVSFLYHIENVSYKRERNREKRLDLLRQHTTYIIIYRELMGA